MAEITCEVSESEVGTLLDDVLTAETAVGWRGDDEPLAEAVAFAPPPDVEAGGPAVSTKVARNEPCPCGAGRTYKHCHGR